MNIELFGKQIPTKTHYCQLFDIEPEPIIKPYLNLYVRFKGCNAKCKFCEYADTASIFDVQKYLTNLKIISEKVEIRKVNFTGGEPTLHYDFFRDIVFKTREILPHAVFVVNNNGLNLIKIFEDDDLLESILSGGADRLISLSRHHYDDEKNNEILGFRSVSANDIKKIQDEIFDKEILNITCNLVKGYIDSKEEIYKYLEFASSIGVRNVGFVSLMPINDYCRENFIEFDNMELESKRFNMNKKWLFEDKCKCFNYIYLTDDFKTIRVYHKNTYKPDLIFTSMNYDGQYFRIGFTDNIII